MIESSDNLERLRELSDRLSSAEDLNEALLNAALDAIIVIDDNCKVVIWNAAAERIFGFTKDEAYGHIMPDLIMPAALKDLYSKEIYTYKKTGHSDLLGKRLDIIGCRKGGAEFPLEATIFAVGKTNYFAAFARDREEDNELRAKGEAYQNLLDSTLLDIKSNIDNLVKVAETIRESQYRLEGSYKRIQEVLNEAARPLKGR